MIKKKAIFAVITMMMLILAAGCGYTSDEACIWCGATPTKAIKSELDGETVTNDLSAVRGKGDTAVYQ